MNKWEKLAVYVTVVGGIFTIGWSIFTYLKPPDSSPPAPTIRDPQMDARAMRTATNSLRAIAENHVRTPPPPEWLEAEAAYASGNDAFRNRDYAKAYQQFDTASRLYEDIYNNALAAGH